MAVSTPARAKSPRRPLQLQRRIRRVRSHGVLEWDNNSDSTTTTTPARAAGGRGGQSASPASIIGALQSLTPQQRLARRTQCKARRQLHTHVRQTRKYADYLQACQESLKSRLTSAEGKAFIRKTALDEKRSIAVVVERLVKSLEAQSVHQYAAYYKKAVALRAQAQQGEGVARDGVAKTASSASSESSESSESESSACDADSFASDDDSAAAAAAAEDDRLMAEHAASGSSLQALAAHAAATTTPAANSATTTTTEVSEAATPELSGAQAGADADALATLRPKRRQVPAASPSALVAVARADQGARGSAGVAAAEALRMQAFAMDRLAIDI